jgi:hypothetical protein
VGSLDPLQAADKLGSGSAQYILAAFLIASLYANWKMANVLIQSFRDRLTESREQMKSSYDETRLVTDALNGMRQTMDLALAAIKGKG